MIVGGLVVPTQGLLSWAKVNASWRDLQLALYIWMVWVSVCLIGAWIGLLLREVGGFQPGGVPEITGDYRRRESALYGGHRGRITGEV